MIDLSKAVEDGKFPEPSQEIMDNQVLYSLYCACHKVYRRGFHAGLAERKKRNKLKALAKTAKEIEIFEKFIRSYVVGFHSAMRKDNKAALEFNAAPLDSLLPPAKEAGKGKAEAKPGAKPQGQGKPQAKPSKAPQGAAQAKPPAKPPAQAPQKPKAPAKAKPAPKPPTQTLRAKSAGQSKQAPKAPQGPPETLKRSQIAASLRKRDSRELFLSRNRTRYL